MKAAPAPSRLEAVLAALDRRIDTQIDVILRDPRFQQMASAWTGLRRLAEIMAGEERLGLRALPVTREELAKDLPEGSALRARIVTESFAGERPTPFGALVLDMLWDDGEKDVAILRGLASHAAAAFVPVLSGAGPALLDTRRETLSPEWRALRDVPESTYVFLAGPRARPPEARHWINAAVLLAGAVALAVARDGWGAWFDEPSGRIDLADISPCLEVAIGPNGPVQLFDRGLVALAAEGWDGTLAQIIGVRSVRKPRQYDRPEPTQNARTAGTLAFILGVGAVMQPLMIQARDALRQGLSCQETQTRLQQWLDSYHPAPQTEATSERSDPFRSSRVEVRTPTGQPVVPMLVAYLLPRMPRRELSTVMRQVVEIPGLAEEELGAPVAAARDPDMLQEFGHELDAETSQKWLASPLAMWMEQNHAEAVELFERQAVNWARAAGTFVARGLTDHNGNLPTAETMQETWSRVAWRRRL
ncbi:hypothetical protein GXW71_32740 [Roseomonas hellenica]|uniref:Uncharacterized protein n=1 Tax=Plastoroseomonas hellenica TaxID=2687306 RepID=A0ABS5F9B9_9PROT|nr:type VI secretion system contractile sheath large subunit [Plastoroseomonas hellenica]MBR0669164.1 hypothetical protein [Plastoroseomonas hellenica]